jgi:thioredoxin-related protein
MMAETLSHPKLATVIREQFETVQFSADKRPDLVKHFAVRLCPTVLIVSPEGEFLVRVDGFADPKKFVSNFRPAMVKYAQSKKALAQRESRLVR